MIDELADFRVFKDIADRTSIGVVLFRHEEPKGLSSFRLLYANPAASEASRTDMGRFVGSLILESFPEVSDNLLRAYVEVIRTGRPSDLGEIRYGDENIPEGLFSVTVAPVGEDCVCIFYENMTELKRAEEERGESEKTARRLAADNEAMAAIGRIITSSMEIDEVYDRFAEEVGKLIPFDRIVIRLYDAEKRELAAAYVTGLYVEGRRPNDVYAEAGTLSEAVMRAGSGRILHAVGEAAPEVEQLPGLLPELRAGIRSFLSIPLIIRGTRLGCLNLRSKDENAYSEEHLRLGERVGAQIAGVIANFRLFTDLARAKGELERQARELERSNTDLQAFASAASHDLQQPLRLVTGYLNLLAERYGERLDKDADEFIGHAVEAADRMKTLIDDVLAYSRIDAEHDGQQLASCSEAIERAISDLKPLIDESGASVAYDDLPVVGGSTAQLAEVFQNLIGNGVKFRSTDPPRVHVYAVQQGTEWLISVHDNGIGIPPEHHARIFQMFERLHGRAAYGGTGIGLALCQRIIERHGGRIWVESEPGEGSIFRFTLPMVQ